MVAKWYRSCHSKKHKLSTQKCDCRTSISKSALNIAVMTVLYLANYLRSKQHVSNHSWLPEMSKLMSTSTRSSPLPAHSISN